jgi:hypothetical protein
MSWDQGVQPRETLPKVFIDWVEKKAKEHNIMGELQYITWFGSDPNLCFCDFGDEGALQVRFKDKTK